MRLLLLTLYYPPLHTIAALRLKAFEKQLSQEGHVVDVITRFYDQQQQKGQSMFLGSEPAENFTESYIRKGNTVYTNFTETNEQKTFSEKLPPLVRGLYNHLNVIYSITGGCGMLWRHLKRNLLTIRTIILLHPMGLLSAW